MAVDPSSITVDLDETSGTLTVTGDLDEVVVGELRDALEKHTGGYTRSLVVDLSGVDYLPSVAVGVLAKAMRQAADHGQGIELVAAEGTIAQRVLLVCALPHRTS